MRARAIAIVCTLYSARVHHPHTIRGLYGLSDTRNSVHGADGVARALQEMDLIFPEFNVQQWQQEEGNCFTNSSVTYCRQSGVHKPIK